MFRQFVQSFRPPIPPSKKGVREDLPLAWSTVMVQSPPVLDACLSLALAANPASAKPLRLASTDLPDRLRIIQASDAFQIVALPAAEPAFTPPGSAMAVGSSIRIDADIARAITQNSGGTQ
ncbi:MULTISPECIES: hypothetical protein [Sphingobium]|uniref:hypothetical protein n=1 Tax=Sphingobium TaxID=165695 RepID=UPI00159C22C7|nr:hypothetical protein [Sphingobium sp. 15-1]